MPRRLRDYGLDDWLRLRPLAHGYKQAGRLALDAAYRRRKPADPAGLARAVAAVAGRPLAVTVVFDAPWIIGWQLRRRRSPCAFRSLSRAAVARVIVNAAGLAARGA